MTKRKTIKKLEALLDALEDSKQVVAHNRAETSLIYDRILEFQIEYIKITGRYYSMKKREKPYRGKH